jgi:hypothetical protein
MTTKQNTFEGGSVGTTISSGNSGGASGDAFDQVSIGAGSGIVFDNAQVAHGSKSAKITPAAGVSDVLLWSLSTNRVAARASFYLTALPTADLWLMSAYSSGVRVATFHINAAGKLRVDDASGTTGVWTSAATMPLNQEVRCEHFLIAGSSSSNGTHKFAFYLGDSTTPVETVYLSTAANIGAGLTITDYRIGKINTGPYATAFWVDDPAVNDAATDFIGPVGVAATSPVTPTSVVSNAGAWTNVGAAGSLQAAVADSTDSDYALAPGAVTDEAIVFAVGALTAGSITIPVRLALDTGQPSTTVKVELLQGTTVIAARTLSVTSEAASTQTIALTSGENAAVTDRTTLRLRVTANPTS